MLKIKVLKFAVFLSVASVIGILLWNIHQICFVPKTCYRPMIYYNNTLFWDEKKVDVNTDGLEFIGTVKSAVPNGEKPDSDFECNSENFMNAKLYRSTSGNYYALCTNGNLLLLKGSVQSNYDATTVVFPINNERRR